MKPEHISNRFALFLAAAVSLASIGSLALRGQEKVGPPRHGAAGRAWQLIGAFEQQRGDTVGLAEGLFDLSPEQGRLMARLRHEQEEEKVRLLDQLGRTYGDKVREALAGDQKQRYSDALAALSDMTAATDTARREFLSVTGVDPARLGHTNGRYVSTIDLTRFLDVSEEKRQRLQELRAEMDQTLVTALRDRLDPGARSDPAAWQEQRRRYRAMQKQAEQEMHGKRKALLTDEELARLEKIESAALKYRQRLQEARRQAYEALHVLLAE